MLKFQREVYVETGFLAVWAILYELGTLLNHGEHSLASGSPGSVTADISAFFMKLVSLFCFGASSSKDLEEDALSLLMGYVIGPHSTQTKDFSPFPDYEIDPTPVVRSFLLQQLLRFR